MIRELLTYLTEKPKISEALSFGHLAESISLIEREKRCKKAWLPHRTQCKTFISENLKKAKHFDSVLVLGSGPHHEIPIELLSSTFKKVVLVDIVHLKSTKKSVSHLSNIEFVEHELTEIEAILKNEQRLVSKVPESFVETRWGMVLSVNIMSQLPLHLDTYIKKKLRKKFSDSEITSFLQQVTKNHFLYLQSFHCPTILISDTETLYFDKKEVLLQKDLNYAHIDMPKSQNTWTWNVAPIPEFDKNIAMKMTISAFVINSPK